MAACASLWRFVMDLLLISDAEMTPTVTIEIMIVESAFISGLTPNRTALNILIGKVVEDGPETNDTITRSSSDSVNASSQPEMTAGAMIGSVTEKNASKGEQPRSSAASSSDLSNVTSREETTTET